MNNGNLHIEILSIKIIIEIQASKNVLMKWKESVRKERIHQDFL